MMIHGTLLLGLILPATPQKLEPYVETLPETVVKIQMIPVPAGKVSVSGKDVEVKPLWIAQTETPWEAFDAFVKSGRASKPYDQTEFAPDAIARPSKSYILPDLGWGHNGYPAINLNYISAEMFCRWLSSVTKKKYRLPTEAEWQLACGPNLDKARADQEAWFQGNSNHMTHPIGKKEPNKLGLHDMFGNVGEWASDLEGKPVLCGGTFRDPVEYQTATERKRYDPSWQATDPQLPKSRWWLADGPFAGFRVVCEP